MTPLYYVHQRAVHPQEQQFPKFLISVGSGAVLVTQQHPKFWHKASNVLDQQKQVFLLGFP